MTGVTAPQTAALQPTGFGEAVHALLYAEPAMNDVS
jgi:hypothetical protein